MEQQSKDIQHNFRTKKILGLIPIISAIGGIIGAVGGYIYYIKVGCASGACPLQSNPYLTIIWGTAMGYLLADMFVKKPKTNA